jgi:hypothetical protein
MYTVVLYVQIPTNPLQFVICFIPHEKPGSDPEVISRWIEILGATNRSTNPQRYLMSG